MLEITSQPTTDYIKVLLVEDNPKDAEIFSEMFSDLSSPRFEIHRAPDLKEAERLLKEDSFDLILCDLGLPDSQGLDTLIYLRKLNRHTPIVILTVKDNELTAIKAIEQGAQDYLIKREVSQSLLIRAARHALSRHQTTKKLQIKDEWQNNLLGFISHELRSPLAIFQTYFLLLQRDGHQKLESLAPSYLQDLIGNVTRMNRLLDGFLDLSKIEAGQPISLLKEVFDVRELVEGVIKTHQILTKRENIIFFVDSKVKSLHADRDKVLQILVNLLSNASKYSSIEKKIEIKVVRDGAFVRFEVTDQGPGIPEETMGHLFTPFYRIERSGTKKVKGTGLGLFLCKHLVEAHGGKIGVESRVDRGSTFWFTLPQ